LFNNEIISDFELKYSNYLIIKHDLNKIVHYKIKLKYSIFIIKNSESL